VLAGSVAMHFQVSTGHTRHTWAGMTTGKIEKRELPPIGRISLSLCLSPSLSPPFEREKKEIHVFVWAHCMNQADESSFIPQPKRTAAAVAAAQR
jgi:hypothetical protein